MIENEWIGVRSKVGHITCHIFKSTFFMIHSSQFLENKNLLKFIADAYTLKSKRKTEQRNLSCYVIVSAHVMNTLITK